MGLFSRKPKSTTEEQITASYQAQARRAAQARTQEAATARTGRAREDRIWELRATCPRP